MSLLTDYTTHADASRHFSGAALWDLFDGDRDRLNITHECIDRWATDPSRIAIRLAFADGSGETLTFAALSIWASRFAHWLNAAGVRPGDRVAIMLEPSLPFYAALFGTMKHGAVAVPLFTLFGPDGVRMRVDDCQPVLLLTTAAKAAEIGTLPATRTIVPDDAFMRDLTAFGADFKADTAASAMALFQYTSGTTRDLPEAVKHTHRAVVVVTVAALYGTGVRPGDRFFCPSSPAWGHGLWHGTLAPLALGVETGTMSGRFDPERLLKALRDLRITNLSAAATHYRMMKNSGAADRFPHGLEKMSFTGEPVDSETLAFAEAHFGTNLCAMYGTTEVGVILADFPGAADHVPKPGALGKPVPGVKVQIQAPDGSACPPGHAGEIKVWRHDAWFPTKDRGRTDADGYFWHEGRTDDVIISAGWTIGPAEVEDAIMKHPLVAEAAVVGVPDATRGQVVKAFVVTKQPPGSDLAAAIQDLVRTRLSQHEYPRLIEFVAELPKTPAGKVNRKILRERT
ncbi:MAG: acetate--CoA ligase [Acetobacteraceae bacterium]|nr:acetate--CoA ligase [Acetobacteraceae bacterium]